MNKKEVSMFMTGVTGRLLCGQRSDFHKWAEERLDKSIFSYESTREGQCITESVMEEITDTITDMEWREIANFFSESESKVVDKETLQTLCMRYDFIYGPRRGSVYEGLDIYNFYLEEIYEDIIRSEVKWMKMAKEKQVEKDKGEEE